MLREANLDERILAYKSFESLAEVAKGPANKVFIPSNAIETLGTLGAIGEIFKEKQVKKLPSNDTGKEQKVRKRNGIPFLFCVYSEKLVHIHV